MRLGVLKASEYAELVLEANLYLTLDIKSDSLFYKNAYLFISIRWCFVFQSYWDSNGAEISLVKCWTSRHHLGMTPATRNRTSA